MTPLIDVVMVLIIFFLIVGKMAHDRSAAVDLPATRTGVSETVAAPLVINVVMTAEGELGAGAGAGAGGGDSRGEPVIVIDQQTIAIADLAGLIRTRAAVQPELVVQIRADRRLPYGRVAPVLSACRDAGLASVRLVSARLGERAEGEPRGGQR